MLGSGPRESLYFDPGNIVSQPPSEHLAPDAKRHAPATERNREAILQVLYKAVPQDGMILEVASGTGEHAVYMAPKLAPRLWQPSDLDEDNLRSIRAWAMEQPSASLRDPVRLDVSAPDWAQPFAGTRPQICALLAINLVHISPWACAEGLMRGAAQLLPPGGRVILYGPYKIKGTHTAPSNEDFDQWLKAQDEAWGVRDLEAIADLARSHHLILIDQIAMPANNYSLIFERSN